MHRHTTHAAVEPRAARVSSRTSGEGAPVRPSPPPPRPQPNSQALLRHSITAPEKKTLKRIEALRRALRAGVDDDGAPVTEAGVLAAIEGHLRLDRGLQGHIVGNDFARLARHLIDVDRATAAASVVGDWLRAVGGIERGTVTAERIKAALALLNDALYDHDDANAPIPRSVKDLKIEKRDGGLQILALLRQGADDALASQALRSELARAGYGDIVVRTEQPAPVAAPPARAARV